MTVIWPTQQPPKQVSIPAVVGHPKMILIVFVGYRNIIDNMDPKLIILYWHHFYNKRSKGKWNQHIYMVLFNVLISRIDGLDTPLSKSSKMVHQFIYASQSQTYLMLIFKTHIWYWSPRIHINNNRTPESKYWN